MAFNKKVLLWDLFIFDMTSFNISLMIVGLNYNDFFYRKL